MLKKIIFILGVLSMGLPALAADLRCEGWLQKPQEKLRMMQMITTEKSTQHWKQSLDADGYQFTVDWDVNLDCIYVNVLRGSERLLFVTARVPTPNHNDSFSDMNLPNGERIAVSCSFK